MNIDAVMRGAAVAALLTVGVADYAHAQARAIKCEGPFARNATHADVVKAFGSANVRYGDASVGEGQTEKATIVYPNNPKAKLEIFWVNAKARRQPSIRIQAPSEWTAPNGIRIGTPLVEVEKMNGKPFKLSGFGWDYGGRTLSFENGALDKAQPGGCTIGLDFDVPEDAPQANLEKVSGDGEFLSNNPNMRAVKPSVSSIFVAYRRK